MPPKSRHTSYIPPNPNNEDSNHRSNIFPSGSSSSDESESDAQPLRRSSRRQNHGPEANANGDGNRTDDRGPLSGRTPGMIGVGRPSAIMGRWGGGATSSTAENNASHTRSRSEERHRRIANTTSGQTSRRVTNPNDNDTDRGSGQNGRNVSALYGMARVFQGQDSAAATNHPGGSRRCSHPNCMCRGNGVLHGRSISSSAASQPQQQQSVPGSMPPPPVPNARARASMPSGRLRPGGWSGVTSAPTTTPATSSAGPLPSTSFSSLNQPNSRVVAPLRGRRRIRAIDLPATAGLAPNARTTAPNVPNAISRSLPFRRIAPRNGGPNTTAGNSTNDSSQDLWDIEVDDSPGGGGSQMLKTEGGESVTRRTSSSNNTVSASHRTVPKALLETLLKTGGFAFDEGDNDDIDGGGGGGDDPRDGGWGKGGGTKGDVCFVFYEGGAQPDQGHRLGSEEGWDEMGDESVEIGKKRLRDDEDEVDDGYAGEEEEEEEVRFDGDSVGDELVAIDEEAPMESTREIPAPETSIPSIDLSNETQTSGDQSTQQEPSCGDESGHDPSQNSLVLQGDPAEIAQQDRDDAERARAAMRRKSRGPGDSAKGKRDSSSKWKKDKKGKGKALAVEDEPVHRPQGKVRRIWASKDLLSTRSSYFKSMFEPGMFEEGNSHSNTKGATEITITDTSFRTFYALIFYFYTNEIKFAPLFSFHGFISNGDQPQAAFTAPASRSSSPEFDSFELDNHHQPPPQPRSRYEIALDAYEFYLATYDQAEADPPTDADSTNEVPITTGLKDCKAVEPTEMYCLADKICDEELKSQALVSIMDGVEREPEKAIEILFGEAGLVHNEVRDAAMDVIKREWPSIRDSAAFLDLLTEPPWVLRREAAIPGSPMENPGPRIKDIWGELVKMLVLDPRASNTFSSSNTS